VKKNRDGDQRENLSRDTTSSNRLFDEKDYVAADKETSCPLLSSRICLTGLDYEARLYSSAHCPCADIGGGGGDYDYWFELLLQLLYDDLDMERTSIQGDK